ncbi:hypothetical protein RAS1_13500 [Phycisphaerae bacterium RAS1]|nr:hypothetical protein RAS1_13500 [Phycisphaerae bacterium RAS1]
MGELRVRNINKDIIDMLRARAAREGRSLASLIDAVLTAEAMRPRRELVERLDKHHEEMRAKYGELPDSTPGIREERDRWS